MSVCFLRSSWKIFFWDELRDYNYPSSGFYFFNLYNLFHSVLCYYIRPSLNCNSFCFVCVCVYIGIVLVNFTRRRILINLISKVFCGWIRDCDLNPLTLITNWCLDLTRKKKSRSGWYKLKFEVLVYVLSCISSHNCGIIAHTYIHTAREKRKRINKSQLVQLMEPIKYMFMLVIYQEPNNQFLIKLFVFCI